MSRSCGLMLMKQPRGTQTTSEHAGCWLRHIWPQVIDIEQRNRQSSLSTSIRVRVKPNLFLSELEERSNLLRSGLKKSSRVPIRSRMRVKPNKLGDCLIVRSDYLMDVVPNAIARLRLHTRPTKTIRMR